MAIEENEEMCLVWSGRYQKMWGELEEKWKTPKANRGPNSATTQCMFRTASWLKLSIHYK